MIKSKKKIRKKTVVDKEEYELLQEFAKDASVSMTILFEYMREFGVKRDGKLMLDVKQLVQVVDLITSKLDHEKYKNLPY